MNKNREESQECKTTRDKYLYIIKNYDIRSQEDFQKAYEQEFHQRPSQSTVAYNFKQYQIRKTLSTGMYSYMKPCIQDGDRLSRNILEIINRINEKTTVEELSHSIRKEIFRYEIGYNDSEENYTRQVETNDRLEMKKCFQDGISHIAYYEKNNELTIYYKNINERFKKRICEYMYKILSENSEYISIIGGYNAVRVYSPIESEMIRFKENLSEYVNVSIEDKGKV